VLSIRFVASWLCQPTTEGFVRNLALHLCLLAPLCLLIVAQNASAQTPCVVSDNGSGTIDLPPAGCEYVSPDEVYLIIDGLPPGTTIELAPTHKNFLCAGAAPFCTAPIAPGVCEGPGGSLGGDTNCSQSVLELVVTGTGALAGFSRLLFVPIEWEVHTGPRLPGDPVQTFPSDLLHMSGVIFGDPDFDTFRITGGAANGLPSPGSTTLTDLGDGTFNVDSFFDVLYQIEFVGAPGSVLEGLAGTTTSTLRIKTGETIPSAVPALTGFWRWLCSALLASAGLLALRRR
jgi:hypothetical protein